MNELLIHFGWMGAASFVAIVLGRAIVIRRGGDTTRIEALERRLRELSDLPPAELLIGRLEALEKSPVEPSKMITTLNAHSTDLLNLKSVLAEVRQDVAKVRTRQSLGSQSA